MKFIHLADLHIGKRVNGFSMIEDQKYILREILQMIEEEKPQAVLIAGDLYDRSIPPEEAVDLLDDFLVGLARKNLQVYIISGNHDSASRVAFGGRLMDQSGIHFAPVYDGKIEPMRMNDEYGEINIWPIPFIKPVNVRKYHDDVQISDYTDAMKIIIDDLPMDPELRNIAISHQFITGAAICESEEISIGGLDNISADVYAPFDYVALGHLHGPQYVGRESIRYAGSPLKYSFSETAQKKSVTVVEMGSKGDVKIRKLPLHAMYDMIRLRGSFQELMKEPGKMPDYYEITLTDEEDIQDAMNRLRVKYPRLMVMKYDNTRTRTHTVINGSTNIEKKSPLELFNELYEKQNGQSLNVEQKQFLDELISKVWEEEA